VSPTAERRTQAERRAASEAAVLRAAAELITERGVEGASLRSIGARAGTSRAMPAYHFGSKDALIERLAQQGHERTMAATASAIDAAHHDVQELSTLDVLRATIETYLKVLAAPETPEERAVVVLWGASFPADMYLPVLDESDRDTHHQLAQLIRAGQDDRSVRDEVDPEDAAAVVMGMARGIAGLSLNQPDIAATDGVRRLCGRAIVELLQPTGE
jgi:AcrR family transcriptional regulator